MLTLSAPLRELLAQGGTLLVPSRQRAAAVRLAWAHENLLAGRRSWSTPSVLTPVAWLQQQLAAERQRDPEVPRLLTTAEEWVLWQRAAAQIAADGSAMLSQDALARSLRSAAQLAADYNMPRSAMDAAAAFDLEVAWLRTATTQVERDAAALSALPQHRAVHAVAAVPSSVALRTLGLEPLPRAWHDLLARCGAMPLPAGTLAAQGQVASVRADDGAVELRLAAQWCREALAADPRARLLVVVPDLARLQGSITQLWRDTLCADASPGSDAQHDAFVLEGGESLGAYPWIAQALDSLAVLARPVPVEQMTNWLLSPFWDDASAATRASLAARLRASHFAPCSLRDAVALMPIAADDEAATEGGFRAALWQALQPPPAARQWPREWAQWFSQSLARLGCLAAVAESSLAQQLRARWQELLEEFAAAGRATGAIKAGEAAALLADLANQSSFAPATGDPAVTITPSLEHPVVSYDGIWVARCNAASWPAAASPDSFLPRALQIQCDVRAASATGQLAIANEQLAGWRDCTRDLRLSWSRFVDDTEAEPSALLQPFPAVPDVPKAVEALRLLRAAAPRAQDYDDDTGPPWPSDDYLPSGSRSIVLQSDCAFRAFAELRLGAQPLEVAEPGIDALLRGSLLHKALELFWRQTADLESLKRLSAEALDARIASVVSSASKELQVKLRRRGPVATREISERDWQREEARARRQVRRLCEFEKQRTPFRFAAGEHAVDANIGNARLKLRFDRIDMFDDGSAALLDYKSSNPPSGSRWLKERPAPVQLLVYLAAGAGMPVSALATLHIGRKAPAFHGVSDRTDRLHDVKLVPGSKNWQGPNAAPDWQAQQARWTARVATLAGEFVAGRAVPDPEDARTCEYCALTALCRRVERVAEQDADAVAEDADAGVDASGADA